MTKTTKSGSTRIDPKIVVTVSDLHSGSTLGLWPENFTTQEGNPVGQNPWQKWLWRNWLDLWQVQVPKIVGDDPWLLVVNGDLIEGKHHRCEQITSAGIADHIAAAEACLEPVLASKGLYKWYAVIGTECHTGTTEIAIGKAGLAQRDPSSGLPAFHELWLEINGTVCNWRHHIGTTSRPYLESSAFSIHMGVETVEAARAGHPVPKVMTRAHRHKHGFFENGTQALGITGPWQGLTRHGHKVVPGARCSPSALIYDFRETKPGELPLCRKVVYTPSAPMVLKP